jgi:hypothetical protein
VIISALPGASRPIGVVRRAARNQNYSGNSEEPAMQQPAMNPLPSVIFFVVAIWLIAKSSKRFQTLLRMVTAFLVTAGVFLVPNVILRIGDPRAWGRLAGLVAMLVAAIAGWMHVRSLRSAPPAPTPEKLPPQV